MGLTKSKVQVLPIAIGNGDPAATRTFSVDLDASYATCRGFYVIMNKNAGNNYLRVEIKENSGTSVLDMTNIKHLETSLNPPIGDRFFVKTPFQAQGKKVHVNVHNPLVIGGGVVDFDVLFLLDNQPL